MKTTRLLILLTCMLATAPLFSQSLDLKNFNYHKADSIANFYSGKDKVFKNTEELADTLTANLSTDHEKFRVLFKWVCNNITYSFAGKGYGAKKALKTRKAVCAGYSDLLHELCYHANLWCKTITGYAKAAPEELDVEFVDANHAWNAIKLNDRWYLVDATWAAGYFDQKLQRFNRNFNNYYFFTDSINFNRQHFPDTASKYFQRREQYIELPDFNLQPFYYFTFFENGMDNEFPKNKNLSYTCTEDFCFSFTSPKPITSVIAQLNPKSGDVVSSFPYKVEKDGNKYTLTGRFEYVGNYYLYIFINGWGAIVYNLKVSDT